MIQKVRTPCCLVRHFGCASMLSLQEEAGGGDIPLLDVRSDLGLRDLETAGACVNWYV